MKKLEKPAMMQLIGGIKLPANGVCYQYGENCAGVCCPGQNLICATVPPFRRICRREEELP